MTTIERFLSRVDTSPSDGSGCWLWTGGRDSGGYGRFGDGRAHVFAFVTFNGPIPVGLIVRHACDTPACVRPSHLLAGTRGDNARDAVERGRYRNGQSASGAKWPDSVVAEARRLRSGGMTYQQVSEAMGIPFSAVREWLQGRVRVVATRPVADRREPEVRFLDRAVGR